MRGRNRSLFVLSHLWQNTDAEHTITEANLNAYLAENGISCDHKTLKSCVSQLNDAGYDVRRIRRAENHYYVASRWMSTEDVQKVYDAVAVADFLTSEDKDKLFGKLRELVGIPQSAYLGNRLYVSERSAAVNPDTYSQLNIIQTAIAQGVKIIYRLSMFSESGERVVDNTGAGYTFSPYATVVAEGRIYIVGFSDYERQVAVVSADNIGSVELSSDALVPAPDGFDLQTYFNEYLANSGRETVITLLCEDSMMNDCIARFGASICPKTADEHHFTLDVRATPDSAFFGWIFSCCGKVKITAPSSVTAAFADMIGNF